MVVSCIPELEFRTNIYSRDLSFYPLIWKTKNRAYELESMYANSRNNAFHSTSLNGHQ